MRSLLLQVTITTVTMLENHNQSACNKDRCMWIGCVAGMQVLHMSTEFLLAKFQNLWAMMHILVLEQYKTCHKLYCGSTASKAPSCMCLKSKSG